MSKLFGIRSNRILASKGFFAGTVIVENGKIAELTSDRPEKFSGPVEEVGDWVVMPGIIDSHVHINEPGRADWEGFNTATRAAAAGGITTLVDMPLNSTPVTTSSHNLDLKLSACKDQLHINCGFWGGIVPGNQDNITDLARSGVMGFKAFLTHSGIPDFPNVNESDLAVAMPIIRESGLPLLVHAELDQPHRGIPNFEENKYSYQAFLDSRPRDWEDRAIDLIIKLVADTGCRAHIVHLSSADSLSKIKRAKSEGLPVTVETCPHYLFFDADNIPDGKPVFKCAPPIRDTQNNQRLWTAIEEGLIDFIVTDHSPTTPANKEIDSGDLLLAWGGISGLQFSLPAVWTRARERGLAIEKLSQLMCGSVAEFLALKGKGSLEIGFDADLVIWNPEESFTPLQSSIVHRHKFSPYVGAEMFGVIKTTYVGGHKVFDQGQFIELNRGKIIRH